MLTLEAMKEKKVVDGKIYLSPEEFEQYIDAVSPTEASIKFSKETARYKQWLEKARVSGRGVKFRNTPVERKDKE